MHAANAHPFSEKIDSKATERALVGYLQRVRSSLTLSVGLCIAARTTIHHGVFSFAEEQEHSIKSAGAHTEEHHQERRVGGEKKLFLILFLSLSHTLFLFGKESI